MLFARFISLVQYHDAKRRFSARHLQTAGGGGNENGEGEGEGDGDSGGGGSASNFLEFVIRYSPTGHGPETNEKDVIIVQRSIYDLHWLHETFQSHKQLGGTLCGRIFFCLPSLPNLDLLILFRVSWEVTLSFVQS